MTCCGVLSTDLTTIEDDFVAMPLMVKDSGFLNWHYDTRTVCKTASFEGPGRKFLIWKDFPCAVLQLFSGSTKLRLHAETEDGRFEFYPLHIYRHSKLCHGLGHLRTT